MGHIIAQIGRLAMTSINKIIGARARALRKAQKLSLDDVSKKVGISLQYLGELERGDKRWSSELQVAVSEALGVSAGLLQEDSIPLESIHDIEQILGRLAVMPPNKLAAVSQLLEAMSSQE